MAPLSTLLFASWLILGLMTTTGTSTTPRAVSTSLHKRHPQQLFPLRYPFTLTVISGVPVSVAGRPPMADSSSTTVVSGGGPVPYPGSNSWGTPPSGTGQSPVVAGDSQTTSVSGAAAPVGGAVPGNGGAAPVGGSGAAPGSGTATPLTGSAPATPGPIPSPATSISSGGGGSSNSSDAAPVSSSGTDTSATRTGTPQPKITLPFNNARTFANSATAQGGVRHVLGVLVPSVMLWLLLLV